MLTDQQIPKVDAYSEGYDTEAKLVQSKEIFLFVVEVKVPSTENPEKLVWVSE